MALIRQRRQHHKAVGGITSQGQLKEALNQVHKKALQQGLSDDVYSTCLASAARENGITFGQKPKKAISCRSILKVSWVAVLLVVLGLTVVVFSPLGFQLQRTFHSSIYGLVRPIRIAMVTVLPYLQTMHLDILQECIVQNPFSQDCPGLDKEATEFTATDGFTVPVNVFGNEYVVTIVREAVKQRFQLEFIRDFHKITGKNPPACMEVSDAGLKGPLFYRQLFNKAQMDEYLSLPDPWSFTW